MTTTAKSQTGKRRRILDTPLFNLNYLILWDCCPICGRTRHSATLRVMLCRSRNRKPVSPSFLWDMFNTYRANGRNKRGRGLTLHRSLHFHTGESDGLNSKLSIFTPLRRNHQTHLLRYSFPLSAKRKSRRHHSGRTCSVFRFPRTTSVDPSLPSLQRTADPMVLSWTADAGTIKRFSIVTHVHAASMPFVNSCHPLL